MRKFLTGFSAVFCLVVLFSVPPTHAISFLDDKLTISGFLKNETAYNVGHNKEWMKIENTFQIETEYVFNDAFSFFFIIREFYDAAFDATPSWRNQDLLSRTHGTDWLRECYIDYYSPDLDIRVGKQQVVWGRADGIKIMDVVCPTDQREYFSTRLRTAGFPGGCLK